MTGPTAAALIWNPLALTLAGLLLAQIAAPHLGRSGAWIACAAFLASNQVAKVLMYEVHPEAAYPVFFLLWAWGMGFGDHRIRKWAIVLGVLGSFGIKADALLVFLPWALWGAVMLKRRQKTAAWISLAFIACEIVLQMMIVHGLESSSPTQWKGAELILPRGADAIHGRHWDSPTSAIDVLAVWCAIRMEFSEHSNRSRSFCFRVRGSRFWRSLLGCSRLSGSGLRFSLLPRLMPFFRGPINFGTITRLLFSARFG